MTNDRKLYETFGCGIESFCEHSGGHHVCRYMKNHPDNKSAPNICKDGSHFSISRNINQKTIDEALDYINDPNAL